MAARARGRVWTGAPTATRWLRRAPPPAPKAGAPASAAQAGAPAPSRREGGLDMERLREAGRALGVDVEKLIKEAEEDLFVVDLRPMLRAIGERLYLGPRRARELFEVLNRVVAGWTHDGEGVGEVIAEFYGGAAVFEPEVADILRRAFGVDPAQARTVEDARKLVLLYAGWMGKRILEVRAEGGSAAWVEVFWEWVP